jgi:hypothetical protein
VFLVVQRTCSVTPTNADNIVARYLGRLEDELHGLPEARRRELVHEIATRIAEERQALDPETETDADVIDILDRTGNPGVIAAQARKQFGVSDARWSWREVAALVLLPFGGVIIPVAGWFAGVYFLWASDRWTRGEKLIGTFVIPGGLLLPLMLFATGASGSPWVVLVVALLAAPLAADLYLALRLRRR